MKKITEREIKVGLKVCHRWIAHELTVVEANTRELTENEISLSEAKREATDGYLYIGKAQKPFLKL